MLRTGQLRCAPPRRRDLARRRGPRYRGPWHLPGPDSHRLAAVSLSLGYVVVPSFRWSSAPELLDAHSAGIWPNTIQHSVTGTTLPMASPVLHPGAVLSSAWIQRAHMWHDALTLVRDLFSPLGLAPIR
jgi:hypothetical protein